MDNHRHLKVLDAAQLIEKQINHLIDGGPERGRQRLIHIGQLRDSSHSIVSNISEGFARGENGERTRALRVARGEADETITHLKTNAETGRLNAKTFLSLRSTLITIGKMLDKLIDD